MSKLDCRLEITQTEHFYTRTFPFSAAKTVLRRRCCGYGGRGGEIDGEAKYFVGVWDGDGEVGMEEVTAVTSYFILQMDVGGHLFRCRIFMYLVISFRCSEDFHLFTDLCIACFKPHFFVKSTNLSSGPVPAVVFSD